MEVLVAMCQMPVMTGDHLGDDICQVFGWLELRKKDNFRKLMTSAKEFVEIAIYFFV